jgi:hypothetical protein
VRYQSQGTCNLALLCGNHHSAVHAGIWALTIHHGIPWATPPRWLGPDQTPIRNTLPQAQQHATQLGQHLRPTTTNTTDTTHPDSGPDPGPDPPDHPDG